MKNRILLVLMLVILFTLLSCGSSESTPDANGMVEVEMRHILEMTAIGDTLVNIEVPESDVSWVSTDGQAVKFTTPNGEEKTLSGGILHLTKYKVKIKAPQPTDPGGS